LRSVSAEPLAELDRHRPPALGRAVADQGLELGDAPRVVGRELYRFIDQLGDLRVHGSGIVVELVL
jgi:hypothetical protein